MAQWLFRLMVAVFIGHATATVIVARPATLAGPRTPSRTCTDAASWQIRLDQEGFSPGQLDGTFGASTRHALAAFQDSHGLPASGQPDCATWHALEGRNARSTLTPYTVTREDVKGPFIKRMPPDMEAAAKLPGLHYTSVLEALGERFHAAPAFLKHLNPRARFTAGEKIKVPAVMPFIESVKPQHEAAATEVSVLVSRRESALRVTRADGTLIFFAPVSSGSTHDPLPPGHWKVTTITWHPRFHYNPELFWDAEPTDDAATIKPGPNNPVGVVWIGLDLQHYGLHGTPEPSSIGATTSHGCVRLTNWDAARVASLVQPGTPVVFE
jgi:lipoprotein-anchoring transpeptidase ErfK/SrfK